MNLFKLAPLTLLFFLILAMGCKKNSPAPEANTIAANVPDEKPESRQLPKEFSDYWYQGEAEITSYELTQARYGELREGNAVLVFVTEDFLPKEQVKADRRSSDNIPVLKLNTTKNFLTGIYPYSIMTSTFYPVQRKTHAIKVSNSVQEWCGHVYAQLNNRDNFEISAHSYFESEADQNFTLEKNILEDELWTQIRLNPEALPTGSLKVIPSMEFIRLKHKAFKAYEAKASLSKKETATVYTLEYPELNRSLRIEFTNSFPFYIEQWEETFISGFGAEAKKLVTKAVKKNRIKSPYWQKNANVDVHLRDSLGI
ncbi:septum formation inhibitor Maf [Flavobacteriaceae bacterium M23B6Z8]